MRLVDKGPPAACGECWWPYGEEFVPDPKEPARRRAWKKEREKGHDAWTCPKCGAKAFVLGTAP